MRIIVVSDDAYKFLCQGTNLPSNNVQYAGTNFLLSAEADQFHKLNIGVGYDSIEQTADRVREHRKIMSDQDRIYGLTINPNGSIKTYQWDVENNDWNINEPPVSMMDMINKLKSKISLYCDANPKLNTLTLTIADGVAHILKPNESPSLSNSVYLSAKEQQILYFFESDLHKLAYILLRIEIRAEWFKTDDIIVPDSDF